MESISPLDLKGLYLVVKPYANGYCHYKIQQEINLDSNELPSLLSDAMDLAKKRFPQIIDMQLYMLIGHPIFRRDEEDTEGSGIDFIYLEYTSGNRQAYFKLEDSFADIMEKCKAAIGRTKEAVKLIPLEVFNVNEIGVEVHEDHTRVFFPFVPHPDTLRMLKQPPLSFKWSKGKKPETKFWYYEGKDFVQLKRILSSITHHLPPQTTYKSVTQLEYEKKMRDTKKT